MTHFQAEAGLEDESPLDESELLPIVQTFIASNDKELTEFAAERRPGRPPSTEELRLKHQKEEWQRELKSGFWMPDLRDEDTLKKLYKWEMDWNALGQMKFIRIDDKGNIKESSFPPNKG